MGIRIRGEMMPCTALNRYESIWHYSTDYNFHVQCDENATVTYVNWLVINHCY